jgi:hypothetical protein
MVFLYWKWTVFFEVGTEFLNKALVYMGARGGAGG